ncbi:MAG: EamA family transporter [Halodesulfurarchaeum sp.]
MPQTVVYVLAMIPAVLWGFSPILSKKGMVEGGSSLQASLTVVVVDTSIYAIALLLIQGQNLFLDLSLASFGLFFIAGVVGTALGRLAVFTGVDRVGASINSAVISSRPLFATTLAVLFLDETAGILTVVGIVVLVSGLVLLALSKGGDITGWDPRDILFPLAAAILFGAGNVARRFGLLAFPDLTLLEAVAINEFGALIALAGYATYAHRGDIFSAPRRSYLYFAGSGTITAVALFSLFAALQRGRIVIVDPLAGTAPLFTPVFAAIFLRDVERVTRRLVIGAVLVVTGVVLITAF